MFVGQISFASFNQEQESETVEVITESMQEVEQSVAEEPQSIGFTQELKNRFIEGGPGFMGIVLACLILGLAILVVGAEILIRGSVSFGKKLNISLFAIGVVIVAAGTSLPEFASSINAVLNNHSDLALGAVVGSNIANLILVMAATTIIVPITNITNNQINQAWINIALGICLIIMSYFYFNYFLNLYFYCIKFFINYYYASPFPASNGSSNAQSEDCTCHVLTPVNTSTSSKLNESKSVIFCRASE